MNYKLTTILLAVGMLVMLGASTIQAAPEPTVPPAPQAAAPTGNYDFVTYGTAWQPEVLGQFSWWHARGWGMQAKSKLAGSRWVHIPLSYPSVLAGSSMYVEYVEFCAASSNGAGGTGPTHMDLYKGTSVYLDMAIVWWSDNGYHCLGITPGGVWFESAGISISINYANATDMVTLYKAWVRVHP